MPTDFTSLDVHLRDGRSVTVRMARADDGERLRAAFHTMSSESRYARFMSAVREVSPQMIRHATHADAQHEVQLVAVVGEGANEKIIAGARYAAAPSSTSCEFALAIVDAWQGQGLASRLLEVLIETAHAHGYRRMEGYVLASNSRMLGLARRMGFTERASEEGPAVRLVELKLTRGP